jgi:hypothetical protein
MALPNNRPFTEASLHAVMPDLSTSDTVYIPCPWRGRIDRWYSSIDNAITTADGSVSLTINGTAVTGSTITVTYTGSAVGDVDSATPTAANYVNEGDYIGIVTTGACDTTCITHFEIVIDRD